MVRLVSIGSPFLLLYTCLAHIPDLVGTLSSVTKKELSTLERSMVIRMHIKYQIYHKDLTVT